MAKKTLSANCDQIKEIRDKIDQMISEFDVVLSGVKLVEKMINDEMRGEYEETKKAFRQVTTFLTYLKETVSIDENDEVKFCDENYQTFINNVIVYFTRTVINLVKIDFNVGTQDRYIEEVRGYANELIFAFVSQIKEEK